MTKTTRKINSVRESLKYVDADFDHNGDEVTGVHVKCKGCGEPAHFKVTDDPIRSADDGPIDALFEFATRHQVCTEIKRTLPNVPAEDDVFEPEGRFMSREPKRLY